MSVLGLKAAVDTADFDMVEEKLASIHYEASSFTDTVDEITDMLDVLPRVKDSGDAFLPGSGDPAQQQKTDNATKLRIAALNSLTTLVMNSNGAAVLRERSNPLLTHLISNLDLAPEVSKLSSSVWVLWLADRSSAERILREYGIMHPRPSVRLVALHELSRWVHAMEGRIAFRKFTAAVVRQLRDDDSEIRQAAYSLLVQFFATAKQPARDDLFMVMRKMQLSESLIEKVAQNISRASQERAEALPGQSPRLDQSSQFPAAPSTHAPTSLPLPHFPTQFAESPQPDQSPQFQSVQFQSSQPGQSPQLPARYDSPQPGQSPQLHAAQFESAQFEPAQFEPMQFEPTEFQAAQFQASHSTQAAQPEAAKRTKPQNLGIRISSAQRKVTPPVSPVPSSSQLEFMKDPLYPMQPVPEPKQHFHSQEAVLQELQQASRFFVGKETEHNWYVRHQAIQLLRYMVRMPTESIQLLRDAFKVLQKGLSEAAISMRTTLAIDTCQAIKDFVQFMGKKPFFLEMFDPLLDSLSRAATNIKKITASAANLTLCAMLYESPTISTRQFTMIVQEAKNLKPQARAYAYGWLNIVMPLHYASLSSRHADIVSIICRAVSDASPLGRAQGRELYWITAEVWPELTQVVDRKVGTSVHRALQASRPQKDLANRAPSAPSRISSAGQPSILTPRRQSHQVTATQPYSTSSSESLSRPSSEPISRLSSEPVSRPSSQPSGQAHSRAGPQLHSQPSMQAINRPTHQHNQPYGQPRSHSPSPPTSQPTSRPPSQPSSQPPSRSSSQSSQSSQSQSRGSSARSQGGESLSQSIADLSMQDLEYSTVPQSDAWNLEQGQRAVTSSLGIDYGDPDSVRQAVAIDKLVVLRDLARNADILGPETLKSALGYVIDSPEGQISTFELEMIKRDQTIGLQNGYAQLLKLLDPTGAHQTESQPEPPETPGASINSPRSTTPVHSSVYMDSQSSDSSVLSNTQSISSHRSDSSMFEATESKFLVNEPTLRTLQPTQSITSSQLLLHTGIGTDVVGPFSTSQSGCKTEIANMLEQVKSHTASVETLAALSVLVTASAVSGSGNAGPLHTAVSIWQRHYTYDMELRDAILPFIDEECAAEQPGTGVIVVALVLLRCLLLAPVSHAPVYLGPIACLTTLLAVGSKVAPQSLEVAEHLLPELAALVVGDRSMSATNFMELLTTHFSTGHAVQRAQILQILGLAAANNSAVLEEEGTQVVTLLAQAVSDRDVSVRKEAYSAMVAVHTAKPSVGEQAATQLNAGQQRLLSHYLDVQKRGSTA